MTEVGGYHLETEIGAGSSGTVWKAFRRGPIPHPVALKRLRAASGAVDLQRMRREATVLAELDHPHIVRVIEILEDGEGVAVAMQYAPGGSLEMLLEERGRLSPGEVVAVAAPLASALASAHRHGTVHGDVKPANILFTSDGEPLLSDFGSVRTIGRLTSESFASTPEYVAPELLDGAIPEGRADVYSLAVVCYHALTGEPPYSGESPLAIVRAADTGSYPPLRGRPDVPDALAEVIERGMARDPERRFRTADELGQALRAAVPPDQVRLPGVPAWLAAPADEGDTSGTVVFGPRPPEPEPEPVEGRKRLSFSTVVVVLSLLVLGVVWLFQGPLRSGDDCPEVVRPTVGPDAQVVTGDTDGNGCQVYGVYEPLTAEQAAQFGKDMVFRIHVDGSQVNVGLDGIGEDKVFLGDWNCDGADTLAHYLRDEGLVQYYDSWPASGGEGLGESRVVAVMREGVAVLVRASDREDKEDDEEEEEDEGAEEEDEEDIPRQRCDEVEVRDPDDVGDEDDSPTEAAAGVGDCVSVSAQGVLLGAAPCDPPGAGPYRVMETVAFDDTCLDRDRARVPSGDFQLCLEANFHEGLCYELPPREDDGSFMGWITEAACGEAGTVEVVRLLPGTRSPEGCPAAEIDDWFWLRAPEMVACIVEH